MSDSNHMAAFGDLGKWVPGFEFLKALSQGGGSKAVPQMAGLGSWVAPTVNVEELDKRIQELRTVLFWLEQNSTALKATIQAMEVQKMTLSALQGMNVSLQDMAKAFSIPQPGGASAPGAAPAQPGGKGFAGLEVPPLRAPAKSAPRAARKKPATPASSAASPAPAAPAAGLVDPAQWWGALTQQFQTIADAALKDAQARSADLPPAMKAAAELAGQAGRSLVRRPASKTNAAPARKRAAAKPAKRSR